MAKLTNKEIDILVGKLTREVKDARLQKLENDMKTNTDYKVLKLKYASWQGAKNSCKKMRDEFERLREDFNTKMGVEWQLDTDYNDNMKWYYNGNKYDHTLKGQIEEELVYQMIDKNNDMEAVTKAIVAKFSL